MPAPPVLRMRTLESEARGARRERQRAREMAGEFGASAQSARRRRVPEEDDRLLEWVCRRSLIELRTNVRRLRRINAKQLRLNIEQSEREAAEAVAEATRVAKLMRKEDHDVRRLQGYIVISDSSDDDRSDGSNMDPPPATDSYSCAGDRKGKGPARKW